MGLFWGLFSYNGRIGRLSYYGLGIIANLFALPIIVIPYLYTAAGREIPLLAVAASALSWLFSLWPTSAVLVKRGHDRGRPAWFSILLLTASLVAWGAVGFTNKSPVVVAIGVVLSVYRIIDYLFMPASKRGKKYGMDEEGPIGGQPLVLS